MALVLPLLAEQVTQIAQNLPENYAGFRGALVNSSNRLLQNVGLRIPSQFSMLINRTSIDTEQMLTQVGQNSFLHEYCDKRNSEYISGLSACLLLDPGKYIGNSRTVTPFSSTAQKECQGIFAISRK